MSKLTLIAGVIMALAIANGAHAQANLTAESRGARVCG